MTPLSPRDALCDFHHFAPLFEVGSKIGAPAEQLLHNTGLNEQDIGNESLMLTPAQVEQLLLNACRHCPEGFALELGSQLNLSAFGIVGYAAISSPTTGDALYIASRYMPVVMPMLDIQLGESEQQAYIELSLTYPVCDQVAQILIEATLASLHAMARHVLQRQLPPLTLEVQHAPTTYQIQFVEGKGAQLIGPKEHTRISFDREVLKKPMPLANLNSYKMSVEQCEALLERLPKLNHNLATAIQRRLLMQHGELPSQELVAEELHMSTRTLHRLLQREGTSFREIVKEVLTVQAKRLLENSELSISQIALELGYSDSANFTRAFKKATGQAPSAFRQPSHQ